MRRSTRFGLIALLSAGLVMAPLAAVGAPGSPRPGATGVGDPYYPLDGNGGYDVGHYDLAVTYNPATDRLIGRATISATATQALSAFDLDFYSLTVRSITVGGTAATWTRYGQELKVTPSAALAKGSAFTTVITYDGVPKPVTDELGANGFFHTGDGAFVAGQPHSAATWFPVNDHPIDKASYTFHVTAPKGLQVLANGVLQGSTVYGSMRTTTWNAPDKMASYLSTIAIGNYRVKHYTKSGIQYWDGIASSLYTPYATPESGSQYAISQNSLLGYKRLSHVIRVPAAGADLAFDINRSTEQGFDYVFVEAHTVGANDWTTLPDRNGHTAAAIDQDAACAYGLTGFHPFLEHYLTVQDDGSCTTTGTTGTWNAATGDSDGYEKWDVDLSRYAGKQVQVSISVVTDDAVLRNGVFVDNVVSSTGQGTTGFENDGNKLDGWTVPGAPAGSPGNTDDWVAGTADLVVTTGEIAQASLHREPEILAFLSKNFGPYPWKTSGGIVTNVQGMGFALETQTRPIYAPDFFDSLESGSSVVVHELTHQWYGDSLAVKQWKNIWLNEGFATYAEWLWSEHEGLATTQDIFDGYASIPADDPFWSVTIGDPGPGHLFDIAVYWRGAMTLHALRQKIGDATFFTLIKRWAALHAGGNVEIPQFIALAERLSGKQLDSFFKTWLYTPSKPAGIEPGGATATASARSGHPAGSSALDAMRRLGLRP